MASMVRFSERLRSKESQKREIRRFSADREMAANIIKEKLEGKRSYYMPERRRPRSSVVTNSITREPGCERSSKLGTVIDEIGFPVAMKIASPDIVHKSDVGGVHLKIKSLEEARKAFKNL